eukprot:scaffold11228_cov142-Skeletonema_marinoi.AAC.2
MISIVHQNTSPLAYMNSALHYSETMLLAAGLYCICSEQRHIMMCIGAFQTSRFVSYFPRLTEIVIEVHRALRKDDSTETVITQQLID